MSENKKPVYLVMVTTNNNNKYYNMIPKGDTFDVEYGRVGVTCQKASYPMSKWKAKYDEKVKKGYVDQSDTKDDLIEEVKPIAEKVYKPIDNKNIKAIVDHLQDMAKKTIQKNYRVGASEVTQAMVDKAQAKIDAIMLKADKCTLKKFNEDLIELFGIIPRKMSNVNDYLATTKKGIPDIITREQDLLDVMKGQVVQHVVQQDTPEEQNTELDKTILEDLGLIFEEVTADEVKHIKKLLGDSSDRFSKAWKVINTRTQKRFDDFVDSEKISEIKELWHGSRNENWWSIINTGLVLRPVNVVITGKMFGIGTYFAPRAKKSVNYTSVSGSYYAHGNSKNGYMAVMQVAYGKPYDVYSFDSKYYDFNYKKLQEACPGANSLHAHAGKGMLVNDEIIVYKEEQCTIKYLVEIN